MQMWFKVAFRYDFRELVPCVRLPHRSNKTHKIKAAFWGKLVSDFIRLLYLSY